jgi:hypothetical protein
LSEELGMKDCALKDLKYKYESSYTLSLTLQERLSEKQQKENVTLEELI